MKKGIIVAVIVAILAGFYAVYAVFFLEHIPVGGLCKETAMCDGECLGFGDLLPDYSHQEICTKTCAAAADCPAPTSCVEVNVISTDGTGVETANKSYCLPGAPRSSS